MKLLSVNLNADTYHLSTGIDNGKNTFSIIIGKNGTGKSRLLEKITSTLLDVNSYSQNHRELKYGRTQELTFINKEKKISVISKKSRGRRIFERNKVTRENMCDNVIAASISPFDKFPLPDRDINTRATREFYNYIGFKTNNSSLSDKNLLTRFATSIIGSHNNSAVRRTLKILGYESDITINFQHNYERYFNSTLNKRQLYRDMTFNEIVMNNKELYSRVLADDNYFMSQLILRELSNKQDARISNKTITDLIGRKELPQSFSTRNKINDDMASSLIRSLELNISSVSSIRLRKKNSTDRLRLEDASSGERSLLLLVCSVASLIKDNCLVLIDEPEISLHPEWQETFIDLIYNAFSNYEKCHFIIATHSPLIISNLPKDNCFILNMDSNETLRSIDYHNRSADYQLARLFNTPGFQNEYLNRLCVSMLSDFSKGTEITDDMRKNITFLLSIYDSLDDKDHVKSLIKIIDKTWGLVCR
ncbi:AAA family ATPase [Aeromonas hydrophila]|uniref:AAA family ATPase n=1 Tax=Aeromonas hydrophila TaxID=644 RepID=UPI00191DC2BD|nr:ATP-binding protein [Aeromonas hydrophila]MBL0562081.1 ATP-binding protein [Aeromonas hydrophila]